MNLCTDCINLSSSNGDNKCSLNHTVITVNKKPWYMHGICIDYKEERLEIPSISVPDSEIILPEEVVANGSKPIPKPQQSFRKYRPFKNDNQ
jgi:hypothetical protein